LGSNSTWGEQGYRGYSGFAWYRFRVILPAESEHLGILIPRLRTSYEIFADGKPVGQFGEIPPHGRYVIGFDQIFPIPADTSSAGHPIVVAVRVWNMDWLARLGGGLEGAPTIGEMEALKALKTQNDWERFWSVTAGNALMLMNLVAAFAGFFLFWMRPADREYLWLYPSEQRILFCGLVWWCTGCMKEAGVARRRRSQAEAEALVAEFEASGLLREAFCQQRGLALGTLDKYRRRAHKRQESSGGPLLPVEVVWSSGQNPNRDAGREGVLVVELHGGRRIEVRRGFDAGTLERLLTVLDRA
jgi:hypothetical protein